MKIGILNVIARETVSSQTAKAPQTQFRKRDLFYLVPLWFISLIAPDPYLYHKKDFKKKDIFYLTAICLAPLIWSDSHFHHLMVLAGIYAILALGLSLFMGYAGQISLGHATFFWLAAAALYARLRRGILHLRREPWM